MKIRSKILILLMMGALVPLSMTYFFIFYIGQDVLEKDARDALSANARQLAGRVADRIEWTLETHRMVVSSIPFEQFAAPDLPRALSIPYLQLSFSNVVVLLDSSGKAIVPPYRPPAEETESRGRPYVDDAELERFSHNVPLDLALNASMALGPVYLSGGGAPRIVTASAVPVSRDTSWVLAVGVSLDEICNIIEMFVRDTPADVRLLDPRGYSICQDGFPEVWETEQDWPRISGQANDTVVVGSGSQGEVLSAVSEVPLTGWRVSVEQSRSAASAKLHRIFRVILIWGGISLLFAMVGGVVLSKGLTAPLGSLLNASSKVADGHYDTSIVVRSKDEIGHLSKAFNQMTREIQKWNTELQLRVEEKTKALREAQEQIIKTQKLAAVGELGAGVAHEINNPLTGVIGNAQLLLSEVEPNSDAAEILNEIIVNSRRVAEVVDGLLRFSQSRWSETTAPLDLRNVIEDTISMFRSRFAEAGVEVILEAEENLRVNGVEGDLQLVCSHLFSNALYAMPHGGTLRLGLVQVEGGAAMMTVEDNGVGMTDAVRRRAMDPFFTTARPGSGAKGIGLTTVHRIVVEHDGKIVIESEKDKGTRVIVYLPGSLALSK